MFETLVVSGGAFNGMRLIGAIMYIDQQVDLSTIKSFRGTSVGSIICVFLAMRMQPDHILACLLQQRCLEKLAVNPHDLLRIVKEGHLFPFSIISDAITAILLQVHGSIPTFRQIQEEFDSRLECITYNMTTRSEERLNADTTPDMDVVTAIRLSSCLPIFFDKAWYKDNLYTDGAMLESFPILPEDDKPTTIGVYVDSDHASYDTLIGYLHQLLYIPYRHRMMEKIKTLSQACIVRIKTSDTGLAFTGNVSTCMLHVSDGYAQTKSIESRNFMFVSFTQSES